MPTGQWLVYTPIYVGAPSCQGSTRERGNNERRVFPVQSMRRPDSGAGQKDAYIPGDGRSAALHYGENEKTVRGNPVREMPRGTRNGQREKL